MLLKPIEKADIPPIQWGGERRQRIPESQFAEEAVAEFIVFGHDIAEVDVPEGYDATKVSQGARDAAWKFSSKHEAARDIRAIKRGRRVFLEKIDRSRP